MIAKRRALPGPFHQSSAAPELGGGTDEANENGSYGRI